MGSAVGNKIAAHSHGARLSDANCRYRYTSTEVHAANRRREAEPAQIAGLTHSWPYRPLTSLAFIATAIGTGSATSAARHQFG